MPSSPGKGKASPSAQVIGDKRMPYMLHALQVRHRRLHGVRFLFDDDEGHAMFVCWRALGLKDSSKDKDWSNAAGWYREMSKPEREALDQRVAAFSLTLGNIAAAARFTMADRERFAHEARYEDGETKRPMQALLQLPTIDADIEEVRRDKRNEARRLRWQEANAVATSKSSDGREVGLLEVIALIESTPGR